MRPEEWRTVKTFELLHLLALNVEQAVGVEGILERIWPDAPEDRARASLRTAASQIRRTLGEDCVARVGSSLVLHGAWVDASAYAAFVEEADQARRAEDHRSVVSLVRAAEALCTGDLPLVDVSADWAFDVQQRMTDKRARTLLDGAEAARSLNWLRDSLDLAQRAMQIEPRSEQATRLVMHAWGGLGEIEKALRAYEQTREYLADTLGVDPSPQTRALHLQLLTSTVEATVGVGIVGHIQPVGELMSALTRMHRRGASTLREGVVELVGPPGSGRDTVIREACRRLGMAARYVPAEVLAAPEPPWVDGQETSSVSRPDVAVLTRPASAEMPALDVLLERARKWEVVLVVVTDDPGSPTLHQRAGPHPGYEAIRVSALTLEELEDIATSRLQGALTPELLHALHLECGGYSGRACRTLWRWLHDRSVVWTPAGLSLCRDDAADGSEPSLEPAHSFEQLPPHGLDVLSIVAVLGQEATRSGIVEVLDKLRPGHRVDVDEVLDELIDQGALQVGLSGYRMRSRHCRSRMLAWLRPVARRMLHTVVADTLELEPTARIQHWLAGGEHDRACDFATEMLEIAHARDDHLLAEDMRQALSGVLPGPQVKVTVPVRIAGGAARRPPVRECQEGAFDAAARR